jgi:casein kinase I family protein HRR25
VSTHLGIE